MTVKFDDGFKEIAFFDLNNDIVYANFDDNSPCSGSLYLEATYAWSGAIYMSGDFLPGDTACIDRPKDCGS